MLNKYRIAILLLIIIIIISLIFYTYTGSQLISNKKAKKMIETKKIKYIIDVRTKYEFQMGHYPNALHLPVSNIKQIKKKFPFIKKTDSILVYCNTGQRARSASETLNDLGYMNVFYIATTYHSLI